MNRAEAVAIATAALYPKGLPHPGCGPTAVRYDPVADRYQVVFPVVWWVNRNTLRKLARLREPIPKAPGVRDPSNAAVTVDGKTKRARVD